MKTAKLFANGKSQAVRLPKEYRFVGDEVGVMKVGEVVMLYPADSKWEHFLGTEPISDDVGDVIFESRQNEYPTMWRVKL